MTSTGLKPARAFNPLGTGVSPYAARSDDMRLYTMISVEETFTQTNAANVYEALIVVPAGCTVRDVTFRNTVVWNAGTSASLVVGDDDDADGYFTATNLLTTPAADVNGHGGFSTGHSVGASVGAYGGAAGKFCAAEKTITATITTVGAGTAGRSRLMVLYAVPLSTEDGTRLV